jgi:hypothetical protein
MARDAEVREFDRSCVLVVATALAVFVLLCVLDAVDVLIMRLPRPAAWFLLLLLPACIALHYRYQLPSRTSLAAAIVTTVISLGLAVLLSVTLGLGLHVALGGGL